MERYSSGEISPSFLRLLTQAEQEMIINELVFPLTELVEYDVRELPISGGETFGRQPSLNPSDGA